MQEAVLELIEEQLAQEELQDLPLAEMKTSNFMPAATMHSLLTQYRMMLRGCILRQQPVISLR